MATLPSPSGLAVRRCLSTSSALRVSSNVGRPLSVNGPSARVLCSDIFFFRSMEDSTVDLEVVQCLVIIDCM